MADLTELLINFPVADSKDKQSAALQEYGSLPVVCPSLRCEMPCTIDFNNKTRLMTVEGHDEIANDSLLIDLNGIMLQKVIPQMPLLRSHLTSEFPGLL